MGDLNSHMNSLVRQVEQSSPINIEDKFLHSLLYQYGFTDVLQPFHQNYLSSSEFHSYKGNDVASSSRIDYQLISSSLLPALFYASNTWPERQITMSDHSFVRL